MVVEVAARNLLLGLVLLLMLISPGRAKASGWDSLSADRRTGDSLV